MSEIDSIKKILERERVARKQAEKLLEEKSLEIYEINQKLLHINSNLEKEVIDRTNQILESEKQLRVLFDNHPDPILVVDMENCKVMAANETATKLLKIDLDSLVGLYFKSLITESKETFESVNLSKSFRTTIDVNGESVILQIHGNRLQYHKKDAVILVLEDITKVVKAEEERVESERKYKQLVESASDIIYTCNGRGIFTYVNPQSVNMTGYSEEKLLSMHFTELIRDDYKEVLYTYYINQINSKVKESYIEFPIVTKSGDEIWLGQKVDFNERENGVEFVALARNISQRKESEELLKRSEEKYRNIIENMRLGFLEVDNDDVIQTVYPKFCEMTGYTEDELKGKRALDILMDEESRAIMKDQNNARLRGESSVYEVQLQKKNGDHIWVIISGAPFYDENGVQTGSVGIHLDITEQKNIEQELRLAKESAEKSAKIKEEFMANMSHEIRTPMNAIIGMGELLEETTLDKTQKEYLNAISKSASNLRILIDDILDFSKIESGKLELNKEKHNLKELIEEISKTFEMSAVKKSNDIKIEFNGDHETYWFDRLRLNQVLINLVGNALKFTIDGLVTIKVDQIEENEKTTKLRLAVEDTGVGIPKEKLRTIFESFKQADRSTQEKFGGTGLGLSISQKLVGLMGGQLMVESELDVGSEFFFEIELEQSEEIKKSSEQIRLPKGYIDGKQILIVEDQKFNQMMITTILNKWGGHTKVAENGQIAVDLVKEEQFDLIFMDMRMPVMGGLEATEIIKQDLKVETPIVALTANVLEGDQIKYKEAGMIDYLSKPFKQSELIELLLKIEF